MKTFVSELVVKHIGGKEALQICDTFTPKPDVYNASD